jgi:hypothetical protein
VNVRPSTDHAGPRGLHGEPDATEQSCPDHPSAELRLLQSLTTCRRPRVWLACLRGASHEVRGSYSTIHLPSPLDPGLPHPVRSAFRVSHPPDGLLLDRLPGLVSCRSAHGVPIPSELSPRAEP